MRSVENVECRKCGVWKMRSVENVECRKYIKEKDYIYIYTCIKNSVSLGLSSLFICKQNINLALMMLFSLGS